MSVFVTQHPFMWETAPNQGQAPSLSNQTDYDGLPTEFQLTSSM